MYLTASKHVAACTRSLMTKSCMIMKLTIAMLMLCTLQVNAHSYAQKLTIAKKNALLPEVFKAIERQTGYLFFYDKDQVRKAEPIDIALTNATIEQALNTCLKDQLFTYAIVKNTIVIQQKSAVVPDATHVNLTTPILSPPPILIKGRVTGRDAKPLQGVSVMIAGTRTGTTTNSEGRFSLTVSDENNIVLEFSSIGYEPVTVPVTKETDINVTLEEAVGGLSDVVVVGYGSQKKVSLTSAVSQVRGEDLTRRPVSNMQQALQGQAPGLSILDMGGGPGRSQATMRIRGITTIDNTTNSNINNSNSNIKNNPLVIVDGVEQQLEDINPNDIESVSVLKDASSTAIYGSRAANGVILITTKRAKSGKVSVNYNGFYALQQSVNNPEHMGLEDYLRMQNVAWQNVGAAPKYTEQQIVEYVISTDRYKYPLPYSMAEAVLRTSPQINHSLAISGGSETFKARLSLRYQDQEGIIANSGSKISEVRVNTDFRVSPKINIGTDVNYRYVNSLAPVNEGAVFERLKHGSIFTVPKYPDGTYGISAQGQNALLLAEIDGTTRTGDEYLISNIKGDWEILKGLKFTTQFAARVNLTREKRFSNSYTIYDYYNPAIVRRSVPLNSLTEERNNSREVNLNNLLNYTTKLGAHGMNMLVGYSQIENKASNLTAYRQGFYNNDLQSIGQGTNDATRNNSGRDFNWGLRSYFSRFNYSFGDKYLFEANARYDGSSRFTGDNQYSFFPSFSAGWRLSEENFWSRFSGFMNEFKLRGSWGRTGNQALPLYSYYATLDLVNYSLNGVPVQGYTQQQLADKDITWETTTQFDAGVDAQFLNNRFSISVDYYNKRTDGVLLSLPVPGVLGLQPSPQNAGVVDNTGWEFLAGTRNSFGAFRVTADINLSINNNKVIDLAGTGPYIIGGDVDPRFITAEGYPINSFWGYKSDGLFQTAEEIKNSPTLVANTKPGDVRFVDLNKDGKINAGDMTFLGTTFPKYTFGSNVNLSYKAFSLNILFQGAAEVDTRFSGALGDMGNLEGFTHNIYANNYWTPDRPNARFPRPTKNQLYNQSSSDRMVLDASYLRLKNIQLIYEVPAVLSRKAYVQRMNVYFSGTNLLTFSKLNEWNLDPESQPGRINYYPQTSLYTFGVNLQF